MKRKKVGICINDLDLDLFHYLHAVKVATYEQISRDVYCDYSLKGVGNRIRKLEDNKYIRTSSSRLLSHGKRTVTLLKQTYKKFVSNKNDMRVETKSDALKHDLALVDIRNQFLKSEKTKHYFTENQIQTWEADHRRYNSDAMITSKLIDEPINIPLEYEGSMKKEARYVPFLKRYYQADEYPIILFISDSDTIMCKLMKLEKQLFGWDKPKFFYQNISILLSDDSLPFKNCNSSILRFGS